MMITIASDNFFTNCLQIVDSIIGNFVTHAHATLIDQHSTEITLCFTLYVILLGYKFATHTLNSDLLTITKHLILMLIVYGLIMNFSLYNKFIYNVFTQEPESIAKAIVNSGGGTANINSALDKFYAAGMGTAKTFFNDAKLTKFTPIMYGCGVWIVTIMLSVEALLLLIYAKMAMAVGLSLAPIFLIFLLWESTKGLFDAWLSKLINFALVPIVTCAVLSLMLSVAQQTLPNPNLPFEQQNLFGIGAFMILSLATVSLLSRVFHICSVLSGSGISLGSIHECLGSMRQKSGGSSKKSKRPNDKSTAKNSENKNPDGGNDNKENIRNNREHKK